MAKIDCRPQVFATITIQLTEAEAGALDAICGYGSGNFLEVFYEKLGKAYLEPYEKGLISLFESVSGGDASVAQFLQRAKDARAVMNGAKTLEGHP